MLKTIRAAALIAALSLAAPLWAADSPVGAWATTVTVQEMKIESTMTVAQGPSGYTVEIKDGAMPGALADAAPMPGVISDVVVDGAKFSFKRALTTRQGAMNLAYAGTVTGDSLAGEITSDFGPIPLTGVRK
jgi:hypothetical protein